MRLRQHRIAREAGILKEGLASERQGWEAQAGSFWAAGLLDLFQTETRERKLSTCAPAHLRKCRCTLGALMLEYIQRATLAA